MSTTTTSAPTMPSVRRRSREPASRPRGASTLAVVLVTLASAAAVVALVWLLWPAGADADVVAAPVDAGPARDAGTSPLLATGSPRRFSLHDPPPPPPPASLPPDAGPGPGPRSGPRHATSTFSLRDEAREHAARHPPPPPGAVLCAMPSNTLIPLLGRMLFTTAVGEFRTLANEHRPCGRSIDLAIEISPAGLVVNGLRFDGRPACFAAFRSTVMELEDTPGRFYAAWILPEGGIIRACPVSQTLSTLSRKQRTPRQRSPRSPSESAPSTPARASPPWTRRTGSSSDDSNAGPAWP